VTALACYRIRRRIDGLPTTDFGDAVDLDGWAGSTPEVYNTPPDGSVAARLYVVASPAREPDWVELLRAGFGDGVRVGRSPAPGAVLIVRVTYRQVAQFLAFTFGVGRFLLKDNAYERKFGLRFALNAMFEGDKRGGTLDPSRLRSVDAKRVAANTVRMRHQTARMARRVQELDRSLNSGFASGFLPG
jgi:uncharacterized protein (TIGR04141 family)